jgi:hypothetical protein
MCDIFSITMHAELEFESTKMQLQQSPVALGPNFGAETSNSYVKLYFQASCTSPWMVVRHSENSHAPFFLNVFGDGIILLLSLF